MGAASRGTRAPGVRTQTAVTQGTSPNGHIRPRSLGGCGGEMTRPGS